MSSLLPGYAGIGIALCWARRARAQTGAIVDEACRVALEGSVLGESQSDALMGERQGGLHVPAVVRVDVVDVNEYLPLDEVERQQVWRGLVRSVRRRAWRIPLSKRHAH